MDCLLHETCEHGQLSCDCERCWTHNAQCPGRYDAGAINITDTSEREEYPVVFRRDFRPERLSLNNEPERNADLYCSETLRNSTAETTWQGQYTQNTTRRNNQYIAEGTQLSVRSGTFTFGGFHFPTVGSDEWAFYLRQFDEYQQSEDSKRFIERHIRRVRDELRSSQNMDNNGMGERSPDLVRDNNPGRSNQDNNTEPTKYNRCKKRLFSTVEETSIHPIEPPSTPNRASCSTAKRGKFSKAGPEQGGGKKTKGSDHSTAGKEKEVDGSKYNRGTSGIGRGRPVEYSDSEDSDTSASGEYQ
uniref:Uncharacterized protein n=1 Tax=Parvoviridae sp. TaxID=1940570 RepID=A0A7D3UKR4_9VIRU|nr:MAG: hypothetical protein [Parvoviridae sp.]